MAMVGNPGLLRRTGPGSDHGRRADVGFSESSHHSPSSPPHGGSALPSCWWLSRAITCCVVESTRPHRMRASSLHLFVSTGLAIILVGASVLVWVVDPAVVQEESIDGEDLFMAKGCGSCHQILGLSEGSIGPDLTALAEVAATRVEDLTAEEYVRQSLLDPQAFVVPASSVTEMPTLPLAQSEVDVLVEFLLESR
ncbi:MAG: c-type cytochrome [Acidimicrobiia bacterium]|nr:c-type cytochrome [Acidimicrobiia bacterium]